MKQISSNHKANHSDPRNLGPLASAGSKGISILPPAYGIDALDRGISDFPSGSPSIGKAVIQTKLKSGQVEDAFEEEADRVAARVIRSPNLAAARSVDGQEQVQDEIAEEPVKRLATGGGSVIQRALNFNNTKWSDANRIKWVKGVDQPNLGENVLRYSDKNGNNLWVKTNEDAAAAMAVEGLVTSASITRAIKRAGGRGKAGWSITTPQVRAATPADRAGMTAKLTKLIGKITIEPAVTNQNRTTLSNTLQNSEVAIMNTAIGDSADIALNPEAGEPWLTDRKYRKTLGYTSVLDILAGNFDRTIGLLAPNNWMIAPENRTVSLFDNIQRGAFDISVEDWALNPWVIRLHEQNWDGFRDNLANYWAANPQWEAIDDANKGPWLDDFISGMEEGLKDLPQISEHFEHTIEALPDPKTANLRQRIAFLLG